jgi:hypothetical protein
MEIWRDVTDWEDFYEVSSYGNIRRKKSKRFLKQSPRPKGYLAVTFYNGGKETRKSYLVHRVVAEAFLGKSDLQVNHKDFNKTNNHIDNLEYCTNLENMQHAVKGGIYVEDRNKRKRKIEQIDPITNEVVKVWDSILEAKIAGYWAADLVARGIAKSSRGYKWRFLDERISKN